MADTIPTEGVNDTPLGMFLYLREGGGGGRILEINSANESYLPGSCMHKMASLYLTYSMEKQQQSWKWGYPIS